MTGLTPAHAAAVAFLENDICTVPPAEDGSKRPITAWKMFQRERPERSRVDAWYERGSSGVGVICGAVSGNLEMFEFDEIATYDAFLDIANRGNLGDIVDRIRTGYEEVTPGGGVHWFIRCSEIDGNTDLAKRPKLPHEMRDEFDKFQVLIQTRGEGGFAITAPSNGRVHPSGGQYVLRAGGPATIATITTEERHDLHDLARWFDQMPKEAPREPRPTSAATGTRPGDDFSARADWGDDVLTPHGWRYLFTRADVDYWRRPGKDRGISATTNYAGSGLLYVFTSSTAFSSEKSYSKFGAYAVLEHGGDYTAAARFLAARGYGTSDPPPEPDQSSTPPPAETTRGDDGGERHHASDLGNARRLVSRHGGDIRYCYPWAKWLVWDGLRWRVDDSGEIFRRAKETVATTYREAAAADDATERKELARHALRSEGEARINAMVSLAESESGIPVQPDDLDRSPWLLTVGNGTVNLQTGKLQEHDRTDLITKLAPVTYDESAPCPTWTAFLDRVLAEKADLIEFVQRAIGYSLTGRTTERCAFILWGVGRNGKSTLLETMTTTMGDYADRTPTETLLAKRDTGIPNDVAALKSLRFVFAAESEEGRRLDEAKVKDLTGGDTISARFMRGEWFSFRPQFKIWLGTNHKPVIRGTDHAIWDRLRLIPFTVRIPEDEQDKDLRDKLLAEAPGILAWAVQGCLSWQRDGLGAPNDVTAATAAYRTEQDVFGSFITDACVEHANARITAKDLHAAYQQWCEETGERPLTQKAVGQRLGERGFDSVRTGKARTRTWLGIGLRDDSTPPDDEVKADAFEEADACGRDIRHNSSFFSRETVMPENASARVRQQNASAYDGNHGEDRWTR
jgi:putative DNA primase/helicase